MEEVKKPPILIDLCGGEMCPRSWHFLRKQISKEQDIHLVNVGHDSMTIKVSLIDGMEKTLGLKKFYPSEVVR